MLIDWTTSLSKHGVEVVMVDSQMQRHLEAQRLPIQPELLRCTRLQTIRGLRTDMFRSVKTLSTCARQDRIIKLVKLLLHYAKH